MFDLTVTKTINSPISFTASWAPSRRMRLSLGGRVGRAERRPALAAKARTMTRNFRVSKAHILAIEY